MESGAICFYIAIQDAFKLKSITKPFAKREFVR